MVAVVCPSLNGFDPFHASSAQLLAKDKDDLEVVWKTENNFILRDRHMGLATCHRVLRWVGGRLGLEVSGGPFPINVFHSPVPVPLVAPSPLATTSITITAAPISIAVAETSYYLSQSRHGIATVFSVEIPVDMLPHAPHVGPSLPPVDAPLVGASVSGEARFAAQARHKAEEKTRREAEQKTAATPSNKDDTGRMSRPSMPESKAEEPSTLEVPQQVAPNEASRQLHVLVIDDEKSNRMVMKQILKRWDCKVTELDSGIHVRFSLGLHATPPWLQQHIPWQPSPL